MDTPTGAPPLRIICCIPGASFSGRFLECWTDAIAFFLTHNIQCLLSRKYSSNIYFVRNLCLGGDVTRGKNQKPFDGKIDYDYLMWIDSDILFNPTQVIQLIKCDKNIISGLYRMEGGESFATVKDWDEKAFEKNGFFNFLSPNDIKGATLPFDVAYTGFGFVLIKKGVFESMEYPWFRPRKHEIGDMVDYSMEDVSFCLNAKELGYSVYVDPQVIVGHEKKIVL